MHEIIDLLHLRTGSDHLIAAAVLFQLLFCLVEVPLERTSFMRPVQYCLSNHG